MYGFEDATNATILQQLSRALQGSRFQRGTCTKVSSSRTTCLRASSGSCFLCWRIAAVADAHSSRRTKDIKGSVCDQIKTVARLKVVGTLPELQLR